MADLKVGDIVEYIRTEQRSKTLNENATGKITSIDKNIDQNNGSRIRVTIIDHHHVRVGGTVHWFRKNCRLIQKKEEKQDELCNCSMQILMSKGCKCNGQ